MRTESSGSASVRSHASNILVPILSTVDESKEIVPVRVVVRTVHLLLSWAPNVSVSIGSTRQTNPSLRMRKDVLGDLGIWRMAEVRITSNGLTAVARTG